MVLIFGGAYQGKLNYAMKNFGFGEDDVYRCNDEDTSIPCDKKIIYEIDMWILGLARAEMDIVTNIEEFMINNNDAIVICNDISCGIVPIDNLTRKWREETGRVMAMLASRSDEVTRLFCGIPTKLK